MTRANYRIRIQGHLRSEWSEWFDDLDIAYEGEDTLLTGWLPDQPALYGVLIKLRDLGLTLLALEAGGQNGGETGAW